MPTCLTIQQEEGKMSWTVSDAVDYKGFPADKSKTGGWVTAALILGLYYFFPNLTKFKDLFK
jgi:hypothetical protein